MYVSNKSELVSGNVTAVCVWVAITCNLMPIFFQAAMFIHFKGLILILILHIFSMRLLITSFYSNILTSFVWWEVVTLYTLTHTNFPLFHSIYSTRRKKTFQKWHESRSPFFWDQQRLGQNIQVSSFDNFSWINFWLSFSCVRCCTKLLRYNNDDDHNKITERSKSLSFNYAFCWCGNDQECGFFSPLGW